MTVEHLFNKYYVYGQTDCGKTRDHNEDHISINRNTALIMVADGMGGHLYGDRASLEAVTLINNLIERYLPPATGKPPRLSWWDRLNRFFFKDSASSPTLDEQLQIVKDILVETNTALYQINVDEEHDEGYGMGTTVVGCRLFEQTAKMLVFHVGDSRLYRLRNNSLSQITKDHSVFQLWLDGGQVGRRPGSNVILQGIGPKGEISPEVQLVDIGPGDSFLLCSDGLNDMVEDEEIQAILQNLTHYNMEEKAQKLISTANLNGGADNISVILLTQV